MKTTLTSNGSRKALAALAALALGITGLVGCSSPSDELAERVTEELVEAGGDGNVDVDINDESMTITDDEGNEMAVGEGASIPNTWPSDVPLFESGSVVMSTVQPDVAASAVWETDASVEDAAAAYDAQLTDAGFTLDQDAAVTGAIIRGYSSAAMTLSVSVSDDGGTTTLTVAAAMN